LTFCFKLDFDLADLLLQKFLTSKMYLDTIYIT